MSYICASSAASQLDVHAFVIHPCSCCACRCHAAAASRIRAGGNTICFDVCICRLTGGKQSLNSSVEMGEAGFCLGTPQNYARWVK